MKICKNNLQVLGIAKTNEDKTNHLSNGNRFYVRIFANI
jgi:hypothetical protein